MRQSIIASYLVHSAETPVLEPIEDLPDIPDRMDPAGALPGEARALLAALDADGITGAVLYGVRAQSAFSMLDDPARLSAVLRASNDRLLDLAASRPDRLRAVALLNSDVPEDALAEMERTVRAGAAGVALPALPRDGDRYDRVRYEVLWRRAEELGVPITLSARAERKTKVAAEKATLPELLPDNPHVKMAFEATGSFHARRSITAIILAGVFARYPRLRIGIAGAHLSWAPYAMIRADEIYEVRPERTGPAAEAPAAEAVETAPQAGWESRLEDVAAYAPGEVRTGKRGMAPERVGFQFPKGERFSDHFLSHVFGTFFEDGVAIEHRELLRTRGMVWARTRALSGHKTVQSFLDDRLRGVPEADKHRIVSGNAAELYGL